MDHPAVIPNFNGEFRWLSNFWPCLITFEQEVYPSTEHAYQAAKTINVNMRSYISKCSTPGDAKRAGQHIDMRDGWNDMKLDVMLQLQRLKYFGHEDLGKKLIATGVSEIVEGNSWRDRFWGVYNGVGQNHLGKIIMRVRDELQVRI